MQWYEIFFLFLLLCHILCCTLIFLGLRNQILKVHKLMFPVALFLPFWGEVVVLVLHFQIFFRQTDVSELGVEKFRVESELYKGLQYEEKNTSHSTVSLEEALIVNTPKERRALIMDILNDNPKAYVEFLKMAGNNEDTEVVHYAVTAMVQIAKENDQMLWDLEQKYTQNPEDFDTLTTYSDFVWHCLDQGLMQGQVERMNRNLFDTLIQKKIRMDPTHLTDYLRCIQNNLSLQNYSAAKAALEGAKKRWPYQEDLLILQIQYWGDLQRPNEIQVLLRELDEKNIYLTAKAKEVVAFWKD